MRRKPRQVTAQCLAREQMHRDRVGRKGVEHDQVELLLRCGERQARVTERDRRLRRAGGEETERGRIAREPCDLRVDLEEGPALAVVPMTGEGPCPEADDRDVVQTALRAARRHDALRDRPAEIVVVSGSGRPVTCSIGLRTLRAVERGAVMQQAVRAAFACTTGARRKSCVVSVRARPAATCR